LLVRLCADFVVLSSFVLGCRGGSEAWWAAGSVFRVRQPASLRGPGAGPVRIEIHRVTGYDVLPVGRSSAGRDDEMTASTAAGRQLTPAMLL
jgi:hypothetical protein